MKTIITNTKEIITYILLNLFIIAFIFIGGYLLIDLMINKWWVILEFILSLLMIACGVVMTLTAIELTK
tara:strand:- start:1542 stop:1748 length:207 start_codon:yes stop_codon:yes gene_type:complete